MQQVDYFCDSIADVTGHMLAHLQRICQPFLPPLDPLYYSGIRGADTTKRSALQQLTD